MAGGHGALILVANSGRKTTMFAASDRGGEGLNRHVERVVYPDRKESIIGEHGRLARGSIGSYGHGDSE